MRKILLISGCFLYLKVLAQQPLCVQAMEQMRADSLIFFVNNLTGKQPIRVDDTLHVIHSRYAFHPDNQLAAAYLKQTVMSYGFLVEDIPFSSTGRNIIAYKPGYLNPKQAYLIGAHYDCVGNQTMNFEGADDNASGVATLLETARVLQSDSFPYTIILAFWDEEEIGLLGSLAFAPDGPRGYWDIQASINLDMIGYDGNEDTLAMIHTFHSGSSEMLAIKIEEVNRIYATGLTIQIKNPGDKSTDHQSFWLKGSTAIGLTEDYDHDLSPDWHQLSDSLGNMNMAYFTRMSMLACAAICEITQTGRFVAVTEITPPHLRVYPNPAGALLQLPPSVDWKNAECRLFNSVGDEKPVPNMMNNQIDIGTLPPGIYWLLIDTEKAAYKVRFVKSGL